MICTLYSHHIGFDKIVDMLNTNYPKAVFKNSTQNESQIIEMETKDGFFGAANKLIIQYRERKEPSYQIPEIDECALTGNLRGLYGYVTSLESKNEKVKSLFLHKIQTLNSEFSINQEKGQTKDLKDFIKKLAHDFEAVLFVQPKTIISKSDGQHFLDENLNLILDNNGDCEIENLEVKINSAYYDKQQAEISEEQKKWKAQSEKILEERKIKINKYLPFIESESEVVIRTPKEIAQRICILAMTNLVAFNTVSSEEVSDYLKKYNLWNLVTPKEKDFLANPTEQKKSNESWKCECIWTLMFALNKIDDLGFPNELCNLNDIPADDYPVSPDKDPNDFINSVFEAKSKSEILGLNDLYYRLDWACVDARINGIEMTEVHPGIVYERHYALNWLINYAEAAWDDVTCDT
jgi:predicted deacetylase